MFNRSALAIVALGSLVVVGCQTPNLSKLGRGIPSGPSATASPAAVTSMSLSDTTKSASASNAAKQNATSTPAVQPVAFLGDAQCRCGNTSCPSCLSAGSCVTDCMPAPVLGQAIDPQEYLCNGGDVPPYAAAMVNDSVGGLNAQDAVVHYTTERGDVLVQPSNRVCVYSPRFGSVRQVTHAAGGEKAVGLLGIGNPVGPTGIGMNESSNVAGNVDELAHANVARHLDAMGDRNRGVPVENAVQPMIAEDVLAILATLDLKTTVGYTSDQLAVIQRGHTAAITWMVRDAVEVMIEEMKPPTLTRDAKVEAFVEYDFPDAGRLKVVKVADRQDAKLGDEIKFAIRVQNVGDSAVSHVHIADSLLPRLEYVEGSQTCDHPATFDYRGNSSGSLKMEWTLSEPLAVGETALIEFTCKVR